METFDTVMKTAINEYIAECPNRTELERTEYWRKSFLPGYKSLVRFYQDLGAVSQLRFEEEHEGAKVWLEQHRGFTDESLKKYVEEMYDALG